MAVHRHLYTMWRTQSIAVCTNSLRRPRSPSCGAAACLLTVFPRSLSVRPLSSQASLERQMRSASDVCHETPSTELAPVSVLANFSLCIKVLTVRQLSAILLDSRVRCPLVQRTLQISADDPQTPKSFLLCTTIPLFIP